MDLDIRWEAAKQASQCQSARRRAHSQKDFPHSQFWGTHFDLALEQALRTSFLQFQSARGREHTQKEATPVYDFLVSPIWIWVSRPTPQAPGTSFLQFQSARGREHSPKETSLNQGLALKVLPCTSSPFHAKLKVTMNGCFRHHHICHHHA